MAVLFYVLSDLIPSIIGGGELELATLLFMGWTWIIYAAVLLFPGMPIVQLGIVLVIIETIGSIFINMTRGFPGIVSLASSFLSMLARVGYFLTIGSLLVFIA